MFNIAIGTLSLVELICLTFIIFSTPEYVEKIGRGKIIALFVILSVTIALASVVCLFIEIFCPLFSLGV